MDETIPPDNHQNPNTLDFPAFPHDTFMMAAQRVLAQQGVSIAEAGAALEIQYEQSQAERQALEAKNASLTERLFTDELTGLPNGNALKRDLESSEILNNPNLAVISIDLKNFKAVNDIKGHDFGDNVLKGVAQVLAIELAAQDSNEDIVKVITDKVRTKTRITDRVYRSNQRGDEMIILADMTPRSETQEDTSLTVDQRAQRLRDKVFHSIESYAELTTLNDINFSASVGLAVRHQAETPTELLALAEQEMYKHKKEQTKTLGAYRQIER